jgi:hypothetical protein
MAEKLIEKLGQLINIKSIIKPGMEVHPYNHSTQEAEDHEFDLLGLNIAV